MAGALQRHALRKAAEALGGEAHLRQFLDVSSTELFRWLRSREPVPDAVTRKVINLLADIEAGLVQLPAQPTPPSSAGPPPRFREPT